jgi:hypothetical protein
MFPTCYKYYAKGNYRKQLKENQFLFLVMAKDRKEADNLFELSTCYDLKDVYVKAEQAYTKVDFKNLISDKYRVTTDSQESSSGD